MPPIRLLFLAPTALLSAGCHAPDSHTGAVRIACVGDSITYGSIIRDRALHCYPTQLARMLGEGYVVGNFGASGTFVARSAPKPFWEHPFYEESLAFQPDVVVLTVGTNDAKPEVWDKVGPYFSGTLVRLVERYRSLPSRPRVILCLPPPLFAQKGRSENLKRRVRPEIARVARLMNLELVDMAQPLWKRPDLFWDGIHPRPEASRLMARSVAAKLSVQRHYVSR